jgi:hypothetical protein
MFMEVALNVVRKPADPAIEIDRLYNYAGQTPSLPRPPRSSLRQSTTGVLAQTSSLAEKIT